MTVPTGTSSSASRIKVIAHRGASAVAPENTLAAFRAALAVPADLIELDVRFSRDRALVVFHDRLLDRATDGTGPVNARTLAELKKLDAGARFSSAFAGERIPTLEEVIALLLPRALRLFIEIKIDGGEESVRDELVPAVVGLIGEKGFRSRATVASFDRQSLRISKRLDPDLPAGLIFRDPAVWAAAEASGYEGLDVLCARWSIVTPEAAERARRAGRAVYAWTIDREEELAPVLAGGVDAVASNNPGWLKEALERRRS